jgi:hypothetical protein
MKKLVFILAFVCVGCIPTPVRELSTIEGKTIDAYTTSCQTALDNNLVFVKALFDQGKLTEEEYEDQVAEIEGVKNQGVAIVMMHSALDDWLQVRGPAEALKESLSEVVPLIPAIIDAVKREDE